MSRARYEPNSDAKNFRKHLTNNVILVAGEAESVSLEDDDPIFVAVVVNVTGYGPHPGAIYAHQNRFHASGDSALEGAFELLEEWEQEHYPAESEEDEEHRTETFDGLTWKLTPQEFEEAIRGTPAVKFFDLDLENDDEEEEDDEDEEEDEGSVLEEAPGGARPDSIEVYWDETDHNNVGWAYDAHYPGRRHSSGEIDGRRNCGDATLTSRARAAVGYPGTRIPVKIHRN